MDRTAWIVVILCVSGLVAWEWWIAKQAPRRAPAPAAVSPTPTTVVGVSPSTAPSVAPAPVASATPIPSAAPAFAEKTETLRNDDVELHLTNRGGGIAQAVLLNHIAHGDQGVIINSKDQTPIGAIIEDPSAAKLEQFTLTRDADGSVKCERVADNLTTRKKFFFPPGK